MSGFQVELYTLISLVIPTRYVVKQEFHDVHPIYNFNYHFHLVNYLKNYFK